MDQYAVTDPLRRKEEEKKEAEALARAKAPRSEGKLENVHFPKSDSRHHVRFV